MLYACYNLILRLFRVTYATQSLMVLRFKHSLLVGILLDMVAWFHRIMFVQERMKWRRCKVLELLKIMNCSIVSSFF